MTGRVLVCDDERHLTRLIQVNLERQGHIVRTCHTGQAALDLAHREHFDVAVIDSTLPDIAGREVARRLREDKDTEHIRVIILGDAQDRDDDDDSGLFITVSRPLSPWLLATQATDLLVGN